MDKCDFCGMKNETRSFWIGAKLDDDAGFTLAEGTGKMACAGCYPKAAAEARKVIEAM